MKNIFNALKLLHRDIRDWKDRNYNLVLLIVYFIFTSVQIYNHEYYSADAWFIMSGCLAVLIIVMGYAHSMIMKEANKRFPVLNRRMTTRIDGAVYVSQDDWEKAIMYLADIEDHLERQGMLKR